MAFNLSRGLRFAARGSLIALAVITVAACNQQKHGREFARDGNHGLRAACAEEIQKYCADEPRKRRCLRNNMDKLGEACKAALARHHGRRGDGGNRDRDDSDND